MFLISHSQTFFYWNMPFFRNKKGKDRWKIKILTRNKNSSPRPQEAQKVQDRHFRMIAKWLSQLGICKKAWEELGISVGGNQFHQHWDFILLYNAFVRVRARLHEHKILKNSVPGFSTPSAEQFVSQNLWQILVQ